MTFSCEGCVAGEEQPKETQPNTSSSHEHWEPLWGWPWRSGGAGLAPVSAGTSVAKFKDSNKDRTVLAVTLFLPRLFAKL